MPAQGRSLHVHVLPSFVSRQLRLAPNARFKGRNCRLGLRRIALDASRAVLQLAVLHALRRNRLAQRCKRSRVAGAPGKLVGTEQATR